MTLGSTAHSTVSAFYTVLFSAPALRGMKYITLVSFYLLEQGLGKPKSRLSLVQVIIFLTLSENPIGNPSRTTFIVRLGSLYVMKLTWA